MPPAASTPTSTDDVRRRRLAIILFSLIAGTLIVLGLMSLISGETTAKTRAGEIVHTIGPRARWSGAVQVALGMCVLSAVFRARRTRMIWAGVWFVVMLTCVGGVIRGWTF